MDTKKIFLRLKNGANITTSYKKDSDAIYSVNLSFKNGHFKLHSYFIDGNDVFDEGNYKDESQIEFPDFNQFMEAIKTKFPGIDFSI